MNNRSHAKRLAAAIAAGGVVALAPVAMPAANAQPAECPTYTVQATTTTSLSISPANPGVGDAFTATATVLTSGGVPVEGGTVTFSYADQPTMTDTVSGGTASATFIAERGSFGLTGRYTGQCLAGEFAIDPSVDTQAIVAGVEASAGGNGGAGRSGANLGGVTGGSGGSATGGLASTGVDTQTELYGLLGVGLVTVGGLTLMVHRRRVQG
jgi:LPXTG-motif cell wall-anchored protein